MEGDGAVTDLVTLDSERLKAIVAATPTTKRAALSKALKAACQHVRDSRQAYSKAFDLAGAMVRNWWHLGLELRRIELHTGGRPSETGALGHRLRLQELGINKKQSQRCQRLAEWEAQELDEWLTGLYDESKYTLPSLRPASSRAEEGDDSESEHDLPGNCFSSLQDIIDAGLRFGCIYADPPWKYGNQATRAATDNHYPTMTLEEICAEPVMEVAGDNAHLHLWTTNGFLDDAFGVIEAWGFIYKSCFVWVKPQMGIGNYWRVSHEFLLLGVKGRAPFRDKGQMSWAQIDRTKHSQKPRQVRDSLEKVSSAPYLEMYGREAMEGWTVYGNQIEHGLL